MGSFVNSCNYSQVYLYTYVYLTVYKEEYTIKDIVYQNINIRNLFFFGVTKITPSFVKVFALSQYLLQGSLSF